MKKLFFYFDKKRKIKAQEVTLFTRQITTLVMAGIPLLQAFSILAETFVHSPFYDLIQKIKRDIETGTPLSSALKKHPAEFNNLYCSLIAAGEQSGTLDIMLNRLANYYEKIDTLKRKVKKALYYPLAVIISTLIVTLVLLIKVVPTFQQIFKDFDAALPIFTQFVLKLSRLLQNYGLSLMAIFIVIFYIFCHLYKTKLAFRNMLQRSMLRLPILGSILQKTAIAGFARTLATTTKAGLPLSDALTTVASASGNVVYSDAIQEIKIGLIAGQQMRSMMKKTQVFPPMVVQMVGIGEESGSLDTMLEKIANLYEDEIDSLVDGLTTLLEPLMMVILGVIIGGLVIALYLPIFQIGSVF